MDMLRLRLVFETLRFEPGAFFAAKSLANGSKRIILLGTPHHGNLGDHLIADSEMEFFEKYICARKAIDCTMRTSKLLIDLHQNYIRENDIICISGGGWLGTEWRHNEDFVRNVISCYPDNRIIVLPQTAYYKNDPQYLDQGAIIYGRHNHLFFCARDRATYDLMKDKGFISPERLVYMPDMALYSSLWKNNTDERERTNLGICIRDDREVDISNDSRNRILDIIQNIDTEYKTIYTNESWRSISPRRRKDSLLSKMYEMVGLKLLVTDRLHAMIMAAITNTPCIAFDNSTRKVSGVYEWLKDLDYIRFIPSVSKFEETIYDMLNFRFKTSFDNWDKTEYLTKLSKWFDQ